MNVPKIAWRNVLRNSRRSTATILAMTLALWVMILYSGFVVGYLQAMEEDIVNLEVGDIQIFAPTYRDNPSLFTLIAHPERLLGALTHRGYRASPRLLGGGLCAAGEFSAGVALRGITPELERQVSLLHQRVERGEWLSSKAPHGVVLGKRLARTLRAQVGSELVILSQAADGSMANDLFTVAGILSSVGASTDQSAVLMLESTFRELMVLPRGTHQVVVRRPGETPIEAATTTARSLAPDLDVKSWRELMPTLATMVDFSRFAVYIVSTIIYLAIGLLLLNAMLMAVFERIREFGVFKAIGASPATVFSLIFVEALMQTGVAMVAGTLLALPAMVYLSETGLNLARLGGITVMGVTMRSNWLGVYSVPIVAPAYLVLLVIVILAVLYPALKAARLRPVVAMGHQ